MHIICSKNTNLKKLKKSGHKMRFFEISHEQISKAICRKKLIFEMFTTFVIAKKPIIPKINLINRRWTVIS